MSIDPFVVRSRADHRRHRLLLVVLLGLSLALPSTRASAQEDQICFTDQAPEITACVSGRLRAFWEQNGGLRVFGYPLSDAAPADNGDGTFLTQYFERARLELHPENSPPYDVLLGRLGDQRLRALGRDWRSAPREADNETCLFWAETGHTICGAFLEAWRSQGLDLDAEPLTTDAEHLALWGLPLTSPALEETPNGQLLVQWFERARFEQQPDGTITFGLLGRETIGQTPAPPSAPEPSPAPPAVPTPEPPAPPTPETPAPAPPTTPSVPFPSIPCNTNVPAPVEGLQAWMADPNPSRATDAVACVRLILNGQPINGANAIVYRYIGDERRPSLAQSTSLDGVASFIFYIGDLPGGLGVPVEAVVTYQGNTYTTFTGFATQ